MQMSMSKHFPFQQQRSKFSGSKLSNLFQCHHFQPLTKQNLDPANISYPVPKAEASEALPSPVLKVWNGKSYSLHPRSLAKCLKFRKNSRNAERINESEGCAAWGGGPATWVLLSGFAAPPVVGSQVSSQSSASVSTAGGLVS